MRGAKVEITVPQRGDNKWLVEMVSKSAEENLEQARIKHLSDEMKMTAAMTELADALDLPRMPRRIECYDNSNLQGTNPVASMVVFQDGKPAKQEYRRFTVKTVVGADDFATMKEIIGRRFRRAAEADEETEGKWTTLPDLVIIDGGKGQFNAALEALAEVGNDGADLRPRQGAGGDFPARPQGLDHVAARLAGAVPRPACAGRSPSVRRDVPPCRRSKASLHSRLDDIPGVGPVKKKALIKAFGSVKGVRNASVEDLTAIDGINAEPGGGDQAVTVESTQGL